MIPTRCVLALAAGIMGWAAAPASAEIYFPLQFFEKPAAELVETAFSEPYGAFVINEVALGIAESNDPACHQARQLDHARLTAAAKAMLMRRGTQFYDILSSTVQLHKYEEGLVARGGPQARAERAELASDPLVQEYLALSSPAQSAEVVSYVIEQARRFMLIRGIPFKREVSGLVSGDQRLLDADPSEKATDAAFAFLEKNQSPQLVRYTALTEQAENALKDAVDLETYKALGPTQFLAGFHTDLAEVCITVR